MPRISRFPPALTPVAISACTLTVRPPSRTFWVSASIHTNVYGPASSGRERNPSTISSSSAAIRLTCDFDSPVTPREAASFSTRRVDPPAGNWSPRPRPAPARPGGGAPGTPGSTTRPALRIATRSARPGSHSRRRYPFREFTRSGVTSPYPALQRTSTSASIIRWANSRIISGGTPGSPMPGSPRTARRKPAQCHLRPLRSPSSRAKHFEGSRGGRLTSRRHQRKRKFVKRCGGISVARVDGRDLGVLATGEAVGCGHAGRRGGRGHAGVPQRHDGVVPCGPGRPSPGSSRST